MDPNACTDDARCVRSIEVDAQTPVRALPAKIRFQSLGQDGRWRRCDRPASDDDDDDGDDDDSGPINAIIDP